jgi:serine/threonine-protein kinase HipA
MTADRASVDVWADWHSLGTPVRMGTVHATRARGKEVFSFEYDPSWLERDEAVELDPGLRLYSGPQFLSDGRPNFGLFLDSAPDRWGRVLLRRREAQLARQEGRKERPLFEFDYLLGVYDGQRMGALRFRIDDGPFLDDNAELASPPWTSLRELEQVSLALEADDSASNPEYGKWLRMLIAPGRSLGGSRPKASVLDPRGSLWIAKFPSAHDSNDIGAWESVAHELARRAGIEIPDALHRRFAGRHHTFLSRRFDRTPDGQRIHFASAMTMLERLDGDDGASYLDIAEVLIQKGARPGRDLEQLWRRIVFNICVSNRDDHLRNHGFLLTTGGWLLAPAYDVNPVPDGEGLSLNISETDNAQELELAREVADYFRVKPGAARNAIREIVATVREWRSVAAEVGISRSEQEQMARAFRVADQP